MVRLRTGRYRVRLGPLEKRVLLFLYRNGGVCESIRDIAAGIGGFRTQAEAEIVVGRVVRRLADKGLVYVERKPARSRTGVGRPRYRVSLTGYGYARVLHLL